MYDMVSLVNTRSGRMAMQVSVGAEEEHKASGKGIEITPEGDEPKAKEVAAGADSERDGDIQVQAEQIPEGAETTEIKAVPGRSSTQRN